MSNTRRACQEGTAVSIRSSRAKRCVQSPDQRTSREAGPSAANAKRNHPSLHSRAIRYCEYKRSTAVSCVWGKQPTRPGVNDNDVPNKHRESTRTTANTHTLVPPPFRQCSPSRPPFPLESLSSCARRATKQAGSGTPPARPPHTAPPNRDQPRQSTGTAPPTLARVTALLATGTQLRPLLHRVGVTERSVAIARRMYGQVHLP